MRDNVRGHREGGDGKTFLGYPTETFGAITILETSFMGVPHYLVVKDNNKNRYGFPGGKFNPIFDEDILMAAHREAAEETGVSVLFSQEHQIGTISLSGDGGYPHTLHVFYREIEPDAEVSKGPEQDELILLTGMEINDLICERRFLENHELAWRMLENK